MSVQIYPKGRSNGLVTVDLPTETLVYDLAANKAHCLNSTASNIWSKCNGNLSIKEIASQLSFENDALVPEELVLLAIKQLNDNDLLDSKVNTSVLPGRREMIKRIGLATAIALPVVFSLAAPSSVWAQSSCACSNVAPVVTCGSGCPPTCVGSGSPEVFFCE